MVWKLLVSAALAIPFVVWLLSGGADLPDGNSVPLAGVWLIAMGYHRNTLDESGAISWTRLLVPSAERTRLRYTLWGFPLGGVRRARQGPRLRRVRESSPIAFGAVELLPAALRAIAHRALLLAICLAFVLVPIAGGAQPGSTQPGSTQSGSTPAGIAPSDIEQTFPLPGVIRNEDIEVLARRVGPAVVRLRTITDLGPGYRPRELAGDGAATWVRLRPGDPPALITSYAHVAQASQIEVNIDGDWHAATVRYGAPMFDLAALESGATPAEDQALELAERWPFGAAVYCPATTSEQPTPWLIAGAFGSDAPEGLEYYRRAMFTQHNGYPVIGLEGQLVGVTSLVADDRVGGVLVVPFDYIRVWRDEWPQLDTDSPIGWEPRVRFEQIEPRAGGEALR